MSFSVITAFLLGALVGTIVVRALLHASTRITRRDIFRIEVVAFAGCHIDKLAAMMRFLYQLTEVVIEAEFNGITLVYHERSTPKDVIEQYHRHRARCTEAPKDE